MRQFEKLRVLRAFRKEHAEFLGTQEDRHLIAEIGYHQAKGKPLTLKQLHLLDIGSIATVQRRMRNLKTLGLVKQRQAASDRRAVELTLSAKCIRIFTRYDALMSADLSARAVARRRREPRHVCGLCNSGEGSRKLLVDFLAGGLKQREKCVLVAPSEVHGDVLGALRLGRRASEQIVVTEGYHSIDAQFDFFGRVLKEARQAGQGVRVAANMEWTFSRHIQTDAVLDIEKRLDALAARQPITTLCVYDTRHFSSGVFLQAMKCHRDHTLFPVLTG